MTLFYGVNSLCKIDTLSWCQTYWCYYNTKNGVMGTLDLVLLLHGRGVHRHVHIMLE